MTDTDSNLDSLVFDLVEWVGKEPRTYRQVMDAWRTSCPRLTVWEEALDRGFLVRKGESVAVTDRGRTFLKSRVSALVVTANSEAPVLAGSGPLRKGQCRVVRPYRDGPARPGPIAARR